MSFASASQALSHYFFIFSSGHQAMIFSRQVMTACAYEALELQLWLGPQFMVHRHSNSYNSLFILLVLNLHSCCSALF